jgi:hypothetical protein
VTLGCRIITTSGSSESWHKPHRELKDAQMDVTRLGDREYALYCANLVER